MTVKNCSPFLDKVFKNILNFREIVKDFGVIITYDSCSDRTPQMIYKFRSDVSKIKDRGKSFPVIIHQNSIPYIPHKALRTVKIAMGRNNCLKLLRKHFPNTEYHLMVDADDVNVKPWKMDIFEKWFARNDWDCLTFNRPNYYDVWALLYDEYVHHCYGFSDARNMNTAPVLQHMKKRFIEKLKNVKNDELVKCHSAFNGIGIYRTKKFEGVVYKGVSVASLPLVSYEQKMKNLIVLRQRLSNPYIIFRNALNGADCEHNYYHVAATLRNGAKIRVTKDYLHDFDYIESGSNNNRTSNNRTNNNAHKKRDISLNLR